MRLFENAPILEIGRTREGLPEVRYDPGEIGRLDDECAVGESIAAYAMFRRSQFRVEYGPECERARAIVATARSLYETDMRRVGGRCLVCGGVYR